MRQRLDNPKPKGWFSFLVFVSGGGEHVVEKTPTVIADGVQSQHLLFVLCNALSKFTKIHLCLFFYLFIFLFFIFVHFPTYLYIYL